MFIRIFDRYIGRQVFAGTATGVIVLSGVMVLANVFKRLDQLLGDTELPLSLVIQFISLIIPFSLIFTVPWAFLTAILLVFGRMSADNEMVSLRMTGTSMPRICAPVFLIAALLSAVCFWVNLDLAPSAKNKTKRLFYDVALDNPASLFQPGKVLEKFPGFRIYTGKREDNKMQNLQIVELEGARARRIIRARKAELKMTPGITDFVLELQNAEIESAKMSAESGLENVEFVRFKETALTFPLSRLKERIERVNADMKTTAALWNEVMTSTSSVNGTPLDAVAKSVSLTELNKRYSLSLVCITFVLVGIPLGITAQRRETSIGFALSLLTGIVYYAFVILADNLSETPAALPHLLMWVPNVLALGLGGWLFHRLSHR